MNNFQSLGQKSKTLLAISFFMTSGQAFAAGFQLNSQSATGLGRAFAGDGVIADNASIIARNAAGMALFDASQFSVGLAYLDTEIKIDDIEFGQTQLDNETNRSSTVIPNIYYVHKINDKWAIGVAEFTNFGTYQSFDNDFGKDAPGASLFGGHTEIKTINLGLSASYRINQHWSLGAGIDVIYGQGILERDLVTPMGSSKVLDVDADAWGLGYNLGVIYELNEQHRFGLSYRYSPELEAEGEMSYAGQNLDDKKLLLALPETVNFSGFHQLSAQFALHYSVQWTQWSEFDELTISDDSFSSSYQWKDSFHYALGATYYLNPSWTIRGGLMFDEAAQDETTTISVPDSDRTWFSTGFTYNFTQESNVDFGLSYIKGDEFDNQEALVSGVSKDMTATTQANAMIYSVQYSTSF